MVYHPIQKYKFESKSQRITANTALRYGCITQYKNTNLKANHNHNLNSCHRPKGVSPNTKIQIWKQITTIGGNDENYFGVYHPIQKYKFESKSQHNDINLGILNRCITQYKNTNLKANHNQRYKEIAQSGGVSPNTKIQIWKQITTNLLQKYMNVLVYHPIQKYKFESKSQRWSWS